MTRGPGERRDLDVAILGAGLSGLLAAERLRVEYRVEDLLVVEARDRVGGRILDVRTPSGLLLEGGAAFVGAGQERLLTLLARLGLDTFEAARAAGGGLRFALSLLGVPLAFTPRRDAAASTARRRAEVEALASTVPVDAPWTAPDAARLDAETVRSAGRSYERLCRRGLGCRPKEVSLLGFLAFLHGAGGTENVAAALDRRIVGGAGEVCRRLAVAVGPERILLGARVDRVVRDADRVVLHADDLVVRAKRLIVAIQPQLVGAVAFDPPLPSGRVRLQEGLRTRASRSGKIHLVYDAPFWRDRGFSGLGATSSGLVFLDVSPPDARAGVLVAFVDPDKPAHQRAPLLRAAGALFGKAGARPREIHETTWGGDGLTWARLSLPPPGWLTSVGPALCRPVGRIHWAGAETSTVWPGFMEGAVRAAERVAGEVASAEAFSLRDGGARSSPS